MAHQGTVGVSLSLRDHGLGHTKISCPALRAAGLDMMLCFPHPSSCQLVMVQADSSQLSACLEIVPGWGELLAQSHTSSWVFPCHPMLGTPGSAQVGYAVLLSKYVLKATNIQIFMPDPCKWTPCSDQKVLHPALESGGTVKNSSGTMAIAIHPRGGWVVMGSARAAPRS